MLQRFCCFILALVCLVSFVAGAQAVNSFAKKSIAWGEIKVKHNNQVETKAAPQGTQILTIGRGHIIGVSLPHGESAVIYYYGDGRSATIEYYQPFLLYWLYSPFATLNAFCASGNYSWYSLYNDKIVDYRHKKIFLGLNNGRYRFEIHCFGKVGAYDSGQGASE